VLLDRAGRIVAANTQVSFRDLAQFVARGGDSDGHAEIAASLLPIADRLSQTRLPHIRLGRSLRFVEEFPMARLLPELQRMYATAGERDGRVRLHVRLEGKDGPTVHAAPFGATLDFNGPTNLAVLNRGAGRDDLSDAGLAGFALVRPETPLVPLRAVDPGSWELPSGPGPWLIVGTGSLTMQVRPRLYRGADATEGGLIAAAVGCPFPDQRATMLAAALAKLAVAPDTPEHQGEWTFLNATLDAGTRLAPALFFDVLIHAADCPLLLVNWLLRADDAQLARIAGLEDTLHFAWVLVPVAAWREAAAQYLSRYRVLGFDAAPALAAQLDAIADCCPPARAGLWEARDAVQLPPGPNEFPRAKLDDPNLRRILAACAGPDPGWEAWQEAVARSSDWENFPSVVHEGAPHIAARCALGKAEASGRTVSAIRFCRHQAPDGFDQRFRFAHLLAAAI
jgi:hypothetical protein